MKKFFTLLVVLFCLNNILKAQNLCGTTLNSENSKIQ